ncbi:hypothetical protein JQX13_26845 [Archangium violaceum]|nr:hypothetical protein JQX13_26845 [Archangium violaceum]
MIGGLGLALGGCATKVVPVKYNLGLSRAEYRDYAKAGANICNAEPRTVEKELGSVNKLLTDFLSSTEQVKNPQSVDHGRALETLKEAEGSLGKVLDVYQTNLGAVRKCDFAKSKTLSELAQKGTELLEQSRARMTEGAQLSALREAQRKWEEGVPQREKTARQTWCAKEPEVGNTDLYYARKFADGRTEWLFCDGHIVQSGTQGGEPTLVAPEGLSARDRRKVKPPRYIEAANGYPVEEMDKQPTGIAEPSPPAHSSSAGGN